MAYLMQHKARRLAYYNSNSQARSSSPDESPQEYPVGGKRHIKRIDASAPLKTLVSALGEDGCVIINDFAGTSTLDQASQELKPWLQSLTANTDEKTTEDPHAHTLSLLLGASTTTRETLFSHGRLQAILDQFLTLRSRHYLSNTPVTNSTPPMLSSAVAISLTPGFQAQPLHRPDAAHHARHTKANTYSVGRDVSLSIIIPTADTTRSTAAPRVIPGSHLWGDGQPRFNEETDVVSVELEKGDVLVTLGSLYQGLGSFTKGEKQEKKVYLVIGGVNGALRPEDEELMKLPEHAVAQWGEIVRKRLGQ